LIRLIIPTDFSGGIMKLRRTLEDWQRLIEQQLHWLFDGFDVLGHQAISYESVAL